MWGFRQPDLPWSLEYPRRRTHCSARFDSHSKGDLGDLGMQVVRFWKPRAQSLLGNVKDGRFVMSQTWDDKSNVFESFLWKGRGWRRGLDRRRKNSLLSCVKKFRNWPKICLLGCELSEYVFRSHEGLVKWSLKVMHVWGAGSQIWPVQDVGRTRIFKAAQVHEVCILWNRTKLWSEPKIDLVVHNKWPQFRGLACGDLYLVGHLEMGSSGPGEKQ